ARLGRRKTEPSHLQRKGHGKRRQEGSSRRRGSGNRRRAGGVSPRSQARPLGVAHSGGSRHCAHRPRSPRLPKWIVVAVSFVPGSRNTIATSPSATFASPGPTPENDVRVLSVILISSFVGSSPRSLGGCASVIVLPSFDTATTGPTIISSRDFA